MLRTVLNKNDHLKILCIGAHSDDLEIGCGGAILRLLQEYPESEVYWIVFSSPGIRATEARDSAGLFLKDAKQKTIIIQEFPDSLFPSVFNQIKSYFEELKITVSPDLIFTHYRCDLHQDHKLLSDLTWNTFRNHLILEYEIIKFDGDLGVPNFFIPLSEELISQKIKNILSVFNSQKTRSWFSEDTFRSIMRIRGIECNSADRFAEAFYCRKILI